MEYDVILKKHCINQEINTFYFYIEYLTGKSAEQPHLNVVVSGAVAQVLFAVSAFAPAGHLAQTLSAPWLHGLSDSRTVDPVA